MADVSQIRGEVLPFASGKATQEATMPVLAEPTLPSSAKPKNRQQEKKLQTFQEFIHQKENTSKKSVRNQAMTSLTLIGGFTSALAGFSKMIFGVEHQLAKSLDTLTNRLSSFAFSGFGLFGSKDAFARKFLPQMIPQALAVVVPMLADKENLTMLRRPEVGLANVAADIEKLGGGKKDGYQSFDEGVNVFKNAYKKYCAAVRENPIKAFTNLETGTAGITTGIATTLSLIPYKLGFKKFGSVMGQVFGMSVELASKLNTDNLRNGRYALLASGALMTASSLINMVKEFLPEHMKKATENFTWSLNLIGKQAQLQAYNKGEMTQKRIDGHNTLGFKDLFSKNFWQKTYQAVFA